MLPMRRRQGGMKPNPSAPEGLALEGASTVLRGLAVAPTRGCAARLASAPLQSQRGSRGMLRQAPSVFTQCSKCETVFRLSAEVLRAAGGQVRCGKCGEVFNALAHLAEDPSVFAAGET